MKAFVINGPNLNLLGTREPEIYGSDTLEIIAQRCQKKAALGGFELEFMQSNYEGGLVEFIHTAIAESVDAIIINAGAYTHTSVAIHDALRAYSGYTVELHISNPHLRETFRHQSFVSLAADAVVVGLGVAGYEHVIAILADVLAEQSPA
ncbi:MAG: 3-dehydroquinate dehydratase-2 [Oceanicoccus sp.]|jgi:3-dehydroquinate dehydratase-2